MKEGRKEVLKTKSEIRRLAIIKTIISIIIIDIMVAVFYFIIFQSSMPEAKDLNKLIWRLYIYIAPIMDIIFVFFFYTMAKQEFEAKNSKIFVKLYLSTEEPVEVIPIKVEQRYSDFIFGLTEVSKFYATTNKKGNIVKIKVKLNNESESRFFQQVYSEYFTEHYKIKSNKEENKKE